jgi:hypothetical protein
VEGLNGRQILLLSGSDATQWRASTLELSQCLPKQNKVEAKLDLAQSGLGAINTKPEEADLYDQRVIDFFQQNLK